MTTTIDPRELRRLMSHWATGVAVITSRGETGPRGATTNALTSLSLDPLLVLVALDRSSNTLEAVRHSGRFCVNILGAGQEELARRFATKASGEEKLAGVEHELIDEVPVLGGTVAWLACELDQRAGRRRPCDPDRPAARGRRRPGGTAARVLRRPLPRGHPRRPVARVEVIRCGAVLFDLDGVLMDSRVCVERHWTRWANRHGIDVALVLAEAHGRRTTDTILAVAPSLDIAAEARLLEEAETVDFDGVTTLPGAAPLLEALPPGSWAVVTSGTRALATGRLAHGGLPMPEQLITADDVERGKPDPQPYLAGAAALGSTRRSASSSRTRRPGSRRERQPE